MTEQMPDAGTFDIFEFQSGVSYPSDSVTVYIDQRSAYLAQQIEEQIADTKDPDEVNRLAALKDEYLAKVKETAITFHLQGLSPEVAQALDAQIKAESELYEATVEAGLQGAEAREKFQDEKFNKRLAAHLRYITNAAGHRDEREWTGEIVDRIMRRIPVEERLKVIDMMLDLTYRGDYFSQVGSDPDFS